METSDLCVERPKVGRHFWLPRRAPKPSTSAEDALQALLVRYPHRDDLTMWRATAMLYLADWRLALTQSQMEIRASWQRGRYGPTSSQAYDALHRSGMFTTQQRPSPFGSMRAVVVPTRPDLPKLPAEAEAEIEFVVDASASSSAAHLMRIVRGTYPMRTCPIDGPMHLMSLAGEYRQEK